MRDDQIFLIDQTYMSPGGLPGLTITALIYDVDDDGHEFPCGRVLERPYPPTDDVLEEYGFDPHGDDNPVDTGDWAVHEGARFYNEAMSYTDPSDHGKRIDCFRMAELLYLHGDEAGNVYAYVDLGYIYSYDRCEGHYWRGMDALDADPDDLDPYPTNERAYNFYRLAADAGEPQSCYSVGDMLRSGRGCEPDLKEAFAWYQKAYQLGLKDSPVVWASAALRLARCYEEGEGVTHSFQEALDWYDRAVTGLEIAVRRGQHWYRNSLQSARDGRTRCEQELE